MDDPEVREKEYQEMFRQVKCEIDEEKKWPNENGHIKNGFTFGQIDTDGSKSLSLGEVILFLKSITNDISEENIEKIFNNLDKSGDRSVDFEEFKVMLFT